MKPIFASLLFFIFYFFLNAFIAYGDIQDINLCQSQQLSASASYWKALFKCKIIGEKESFKEFNSNNYESNFDFDKCDEKAVNRFSKKWDNAVNKASQKGEFCSLNSDDDTNFMNSVDTIYDGVNNLDFSYIWDEKKSELSLSISLYKASLKRGQKQLNAYAKNRKKENVQQLDYEIEKTQNKFEKKWLKIQEKAAKKNIEFPDIDEKAETINTIDTTVKGVNSIILTGGISEIGLIYPDIGSAGDEVTIEGVLLGATQGKVLLELSGKDEFECTIKKWEMDAEGFSTVVFIVPDAEEGIYNVIVESKNGTVIEEAAFTVQDSEF